MLIKNINLVWGKLVEIQLCEIATPLARIFIRALRNTPKSITTDVYICSDARNQAIRQILTHIPYVNILSTAGNVVYHPNERPAVVIAHGSSNYQGCGAVDYARDTRGTANPRYPAMASLESDPIANAKKQILNIPPEWRSGIIYFNHETGAVSSIEGDYKRVGTCKSLLDELEICLAGRYTKKELENMSEGQNPDIIFLNNFHSEITAFDMFMVNLQRDTFDGIIFDSLKYAMEHSLSGNGSFANTQVTVLAFRRNEDLSTELEDLLNRERYFQDYLSRGGHIYIAIVGDLPSTKTVYRITKNP